MLRYTIFDQDHEVLGFFSSLTEAKETLIEIGDSGTFILDTDTGAIWTTPDAGESWDTQHIE